MVSSTAAAGVALAFVVTVVAITVVVLILRNNRNRHMVTEFHKPTTVSYSNGPSRVNFVRPRSDRTPAGVHGVPVYRPQAGDENPAGVRTPLPTYTREPAPELDVDAVDDRLDNARRMEEGAAPTDGRENEPGRQPGNRESLPPYAP